MSAYDFGNDAYAKFLAKHLRIEEQFPGVHVLDPYSEPEKGPRSSVGQVALIVDGIKRLAASGTIRTCVWDTITNTAYSMKNEFARSKVNKDDNSKHYTISDADGGSGFLHNVPGVNWRDNGMAQEQCYFTIRDRLLTAPEPFHLWILGHEATKKDISFIGMDAGGPASPAKFHGGQFSVFLNIVRADSGKHFLATQEYTRGMNKVQVTVKGPPGTVLPSANDKGFIELEPSWTQNVAIHAELMDTLGLRYQRAGLHGQPNSGKSAFVSAFLGVPNTKPVLVVMSDNQRDLPTWYPQAKEAGDAA